jgi:putative ABC transport system ATP-binding protein
MPYCCKKEKMKIIIAKNLIKEFNTGKVVNSVINDISLDIEEGEFLAITGESGSGKSTLLYLLSGLEIPSKGKVTLLDKDIAKLSDRQISLLRRKDISIVYQFYNLIPNLTIYENIILPKTIDKRLTKEDKIFLEELISTAGIKNILNRRPSQVSGGEQQRAALIRAVFIKPKIIFADEPTGNLDSKSSGIVMNLIKQINKDYNITVVMVTHSMQQAEMADKTITLQDGRIIN